MTSTLDDRGPDARRDRARRRARGLPAAGAHPARRAAAGVPRLGGHLAEARGRARRRAGLLRAAQRRGAPGRAPAGRGGHRGVRGRAATGSRRSSGVSPRIAGLDVERDRAASTWSPTRCRTRRSGAGERPRGGSRSALATRSSSPRPSTTRTSCRGRSCATARARRCAGSGSTTTGGSTSTSSTPWSPSAPRCSRSRTRRTSPGRSRRSRAFVERARAVGALTVLDACQSVPHLPVDLHGAGRRLRGVLRAQDARTHRCRRAVRAGASCSRPCRPFPPAGRWSRSSPWSRHLRAAAAAVRGRHADGRPRPSGWAPPRRTCTSSAWTRSPRTRRTWPGCCSTRSRRCPGCG